MNAPANKYLEAAIAIGRVLVRDAVWTDQTCFWMTQSEVKHELGPRQVVTACSPSLVDGAGGVRLFLTRLLTHDMDRLMQDVVDGVDCFLKNRLHPASSEERDSISSEWNRRAHGNDPSARLHCQLIQMHAAVQGGRSDGRQQSAMSRLAGEAIRMFESEPDHFACFIDPLFADALIVTAKLNRDNDAMNAAKMIADHVLTKTEQHGQPWRGATSREYPPIGLSEGLAGVGHFLLRFVDEEIPPLLSADDIDCDSTEVL